MTASNIVVVLKRKIFRMWTNREYLGDVKGRFTPAAERPRHQAREQAILAIEDRRSRPNTNAACR